MLKRGDRGELVAQVQQSLHDLGFYFGAIDGMYGGKTETAVTRWQAKRHVTGSLSDAEIGLLLAPPPSIPHGFAEITAAYGTFSWTVDPNRSGWIIPDATWEREHLIVANNFPILGRLYLHRKIEQPLRESLQVCEVRGMTDWFTTWGCFAPRLKRGGTQPSLHSWAVAIDLNHADYPMGSTKRQPSEIVTAFTDVGWIYGGDWNSPDPHHYQFADGY